ncbi:component of the polarisome, partial [Spiromyces aspiralis]
QFDAQRRRPGKLERLSALQFQELSTDVYDELNRRLNPSGSFRVPALFPKIVPFLPVRDHYHPKRNQARQKLATLSDAKFVELVSDVYSELTIRYPQEPAQGSGPGRSNSGATQQQHLLYNMPQHAG